MEPGKDMQGKIKDQSLPTDQKVIFGFGKYFKKDNGKEHHRITKRDFLCIITDKYKNTCLHVETYSLTNKNGTSHIYVYWKEKQYMPISVKQYQQV